MFQLLIPALVVAASTSISEARPTIRIGKLELSSREVQLRAGSMNAGSKILLDCSLRGDATLKIGELVARADQINCASDNKGKQVFRLQGKCTLTMPDITATADQIELRPSDHMLLLGGGDAGAQLTYGKGSKATALEARSIRFHIKTREVQIEDVARLRLGE